MEMVLAFCLLAEPATCREKRIAFDGPLIACAMAGQLTAADWQQTHPDWRLERWSCGIARRRA